MNEEIDKTKEEQKKRGNPNWYKGMESPNPEGRPEGSISLTTEIKKRLLVLSPDQKRTALEWLADNIIQDALDSNNKMRQLIWNYLDGLPKLPIEHSGDWQPIQIVIKKDDTIPPETTESV